MTGRRTISAAFARVLVCSGVAGIGPAIQLPVLEGGRLRSALDAAREAHTLALQRFRAGVGTYLTVLSTESGVLAQRRLGADLRARATSNRINLVRALGGGFDAPEVGAPVDLSSKAS